MLARATFVVLLAAAVAHGQRTVVPGFAAPSAISPGFTGNAGVVSQRPDAPPPRFHGGHFPQGSVLLGSPWFGEYGSASVDGSPLVVIVPQSPAAPAETEVKAKPAQPLMIERQGDRFIRLGFDDTLKKRSAPEDYVEKSHPSNESAIAEIPPVTLIYRDGHREEVQSYTISGGTLYADGNYWQSGYWTKQIQLSALDLPATVATNQRHGVVFRVPSAVNEVIVRP